MPRVSDPSSSTGILVGITRYLQSMSLQEKKRMTMVQGSNSILVKLLQEAIELIETLEQYVDK